MTTFFQNFGWQEFVFTLLLGEFIIITGNWFYDQIKTQWQKIKYGGWKVVVKRPGKKNIVRQLSPMTVKKINEDEAEMSVLLKGVVSGFGWLNTDLITEGIKIGLLTIDNDALKYVIDFAKNPPSEQKPWRFISRQEETEFEWASIKGRTVAIDLNAEPWLTIANQKS